MLEGQAARRAWWPATVHREWAKTRPPICCGGAGCDAAEGQDARANAGGDAIVASVRTARPRRRARGGRERVARAVTASLAIPTRSARPPSRSARRAAAAARSSRRPSARARRGARGRRRRLRAAHPRPPSSAAAASGARIARLRAAAARAPADRRGRVPPRAPPPPPLAAQAREEGRARAPAAGSPKTKVREPLAVKKAKAAAASARSHAHQRSARATLARPARAAAPPERARRRQGRHDAAAAPAAQRITLRSIADLGATHLKASERHAPLRRGRKGVCLFASATGARADARPTPAWRCRPPRRTAGRSNTTQSARYRGMGIHQRDWFNGRRASRTSVRASFCHRCQIHVALRFIWRAGDHDRSGPLAARHGAAAHRCRRASAPYTSPPPSLLAHRRSQERARRGRSRPKCRARPRTAVPAVGAQPLCSGRAARARAPSRVQPRRIARRARGAASGATVHGRTSCERRALKDEQAVGERRDLDGRRWPRRAARPRRRRARARPPRAVALRVVALRAASGASGAPSARARATSRRQPPSASLHSALRSSDDRELATRQPRGTASRCRTYRPPPPGYSASMARCSARRRSAATWPSSARTCADGGWRDIAGGSAGAGAPGAAAARPLEPRARIALRLLGSTRWLTPVAHP